MKEYFIVILMRLVRLCIAVKSLSAIEVEYCMVWLAELKLLILQSVCKNYNASSVPIWAGDVQLFGFDSGLD